MSVSISGGGLGQMGAAGAGIPQLRSRSVSLRIGPFGLTYATDQVLWRSGGAQSLSGADRDAGPVSGVSASGDAVSATPPEVAVQQPRTQAHQPSRTFSQELNDARVQAELWRQSRQTQPASEAETGDVGGEGQQAADSSGQDGQGGQSVGSGAQARGGRALGRAISAYLSCASCLSRPASMLRATA